jgi:hypothetical protein
VVTTVKDKEPILVTASEAAWAPPTRGLCQQRPPRGKAFADFAEHDGLVLIRA